VFEIRTGGKQFSKTGAMLLDQLGIFEPMYLGNGPLQMSFILSNYQRHNQNKVHLDPQSMFQVETLKKFHC